MKNKIRMLFITLLVMGLTTACGNKEAEKNEIDKAAVTDTIPVQVVKVAKQDLSVSKTFSGSLEGEEQANIVAKLPERIVAIKVKVGDYVTAGQTLVELDKTGASSQYFQAQAGYLNAEKDLQRMKALFKEGAISQQMLDGVQTQFDIAKANFEAAKNSVELTTPIAGVVTAVNANVGDLAQVGMPLIVVANISRMKVIFTAGESDIASFAVGQPAEIYSELRPSLVQKGRITQISKSADVQSRSFEIKALFSNTADRWFKPGMFCRTRVELKSQKGSLVIPNMAIINEATRKGVYVIQNGKAYFRVIEPGLTNGTVTEVLIGLKEGEEVVTVGMNSLKEGITVFVSSK